MRIPQVAAGYLFFALALPCSAAPAPPVVQPATSARPAAAAATAAPSTAKQAPEKRTGVPGAEETACPPPPPGTVKTYYTLALDATTNPQKVEALFKKLESTDLQPVIQEEDTTSYEVYRLMASCSKDREAVEKQRIRVLRFSRGAFVLPDGDSYCLVLGSFTSEEHAEEEQKRLAAKGLSATVVKAEAPVPMWRVSVGLFDSRSEADTAQKQLLESGIESAVIQIGM